LHTPGVIFVAPFCFAQQIFEKVRFQPPTVPQTGFQTSEHIPAARALFTDDRAMPAATRPASNAIVETLFPRLVISIPQLSLAAADDSTPPGRIVTT
jgi:hypothetical protein